MKKRFRCQGSFTVEAAVIAPLTVFLVAALIGLTFLAHDRVWCTGLACEAALAANASADGQEAAETRVERRLAERVLPGAAPKASVSAGKGGATVRFSGTREIIGFGEETPWRADIYVRRVHPAAALRTGWTLRRLGKEITGWDI